MEPSAPVLTGPESQSGAHRRRKILISVFIIIHLSCVAVWLLPAPWFPSALHWVSAQYLHHTAQYQEWTMFAPNPLQLNRYVIAQVIYERGNRKEYAFPRLSELDLGTSWIEKRYRKLQQRLADLKSPDYSAGVARWIAREMNEPGNRPVRVTLFLHEAPIPRHDRPDLEPAIWVDYSSLLRDPGSFRPTVLVDYLVQPGDLP